MLLILAIAASLALWTSLRSYRVFSQEELVAVIRCEPAPKGASFGFLIEVTPVVKGFPSKPEKFPMVGDQWSIGGDILKWRPWLSWLGLKTLHKLTRLNSRYLQVDAELHEPRAAYDLGGGTSSLWRWLYRHGLQLPFVDAVYGNAAYVPAQPGSEWAVYVTLSGYLIRSVRAKP